MEQKGDNNSKFNKTRCKLLKSRNNDDWRRLSELPKDMLLLILFRLNLLDYFAFGGVCKSWRLFGTANRQYFMESQPPLIVVLSTHAKRSLQLYNVFDGSRYKTILPLFSGRKCSGFSCGYLIMEDKSSSTGLWLVNPLTRIEYHLPFSQHRAHRVIIASSTTTSDIIIVAVSMAESFSRDRQSRGIKLVNHSILQFYLSRDLGWSELHHNERGPELLVDLAVFKGKLYALTHNARVGILNMASRGVLTLLEVPSIPILSSSTRLVASSEKLLIVDFHSITHFKIYELNFLRMEWLEVVNLGDQALFLCDLSSMALCNATKWGGRSNCVYNISYVNNRCYSYSLDGRLLESFPIAERGNGKSFGIAEPLWYFPHQAYNIPSLNVD